MTPDAPKPGRRIPDEGLFTVHFVDVGSLKRTFNASIAYVSDATLERAMRKRVRIISRDISFSMPDPGNAGSILDGFNPIGRFTITPPTLKGDPDEPT